MYTELKLDSDFSETSDQIAPADRRQLGVGPLLIALTREEPRRSAHPRRAYRVADFLIANSDYPSPALPSLSEPLELDVNFVVNSTTTPTVLSPASDPIVPTTMRILNRIGLGKDYLSRATGCSFPIGTPRRSFSSDLASGNKHTSLSPILVSDRHRSSFSTLPKPRSATPSNTSLPTRPKSQQASAASPAHSVRYYVRNFIVASPARTLQNRSFNPVCLQDLKSGPKDIFIMMISDKNPMFNSTSITRVVTALGDMNFGVINFVPTGTLQADSMQLEEKLEGKPIDLKKIHEQAIRKEKQNANRGLIAALTTLSSCKCFRNKVKSKQGTPSFAVKEERGLAALLRQLATMIGLDGDIPLINELPILPESCYTTTSKEVTTLVQQIQQLISIKLRYLATKTKCRNYFEFQKFVYETERHFPGKLIFQVNPWCENEEDEDYKKTKSSPKIAEMIASLEFHKLVSEVLEIKLNHYAEVNLSELDQSERVLWLEKNREAARPFIKKYLHREIIYFQMQIEKSAYWIDRKVYLGYPMDSAIGKAVFKFTYEQNQEWLQSRLARFEFIDTTDIMLGTAAKYSLDNILKPKVRPTYRQPT